MRDLPTVARLALQFFGLPKAVIMVAIAGAESDYNPNARGDHLQIFSPSLQARYRAWSTDNFCSFGQYQIFIPANHHHIARLSGILDTPMNSRLMRDWLLDPVNNTAVAAAIETNQGLEAWSTYNGRQYEQHLKEASLAVSNAMDAPAPDDNAPTQPTTAQAVLALYKAMTWILDGDKNLADLSDEDKNALFWIAEQL